MTLPSFVNMLRCIKAYKTSVIGTFIAAACPSFDDFLAQVRHGRSAACRAEHPRVLLVRNKSPSVVAMNWLSNAELTWTSFFLSRPRWLICDLLLATFLVEIPLSKFVCLNVGPDVEPILDSDCHTKRAGPSSVPMSPPTVFQPSSWPLAVSTCNATFCLIHTEVVPKSLRIHSM